MTEIVERLLGLLALALEVSAAVIIAAGAAQALGRLVLAALRPGRTPIADTRGVWLRFAAALVLALEFALAADIVHTAISPSWQDLGQLAVIAAIRTGLGWFLTRDVRELEPREEAPAGITPAPPAGAH